MLDSALLQQVKDIFSALANDYVLDFQADETHPSFQEFSEFLEGFASTSERITLRTTPAAGRLDFAILKAGEDTGVRFRGIPGGHEFSSLLLAVLNADGKGKNLPDAALLRRIAALNGPIHLTTYVSLSCTNCPDVVQALNIIALTHPNVTHEVVDGALFQAEVDALRLQGVPAVFAEGELLHSGRGELASILEKLEEKFGATADENAAPIVHEYDVVVVGGGPAGSAAAIYSARKGLKVAIVAERIGGQVKETVGIENLISVPHTTGAELVAGFARHIADYPIDVFENRRIERTDFTEAGKRLFVKGGEEFVAPAVIIATGAGWRKLNVEGEAEYMGRGVHFCPHCDGPFYKGKRVAVIGGGNSGIEAAIDLAGICEHVTVLEFADTLRADNVLQDKANSLPNVEIFTSSLTTAVLGDGEKVNALRVKDRTNDQERDIALDGIFVQIGLSPNTAVFADSLELNERREIPIDAFCRTAIPGVYAAGDVTDVPFKQIVIAMGEGAKASLAAFDDRMRGII